MRKILTFPAVLAFTALAWAQAPAASSTHTQAPVKKAAASPSVHKTPVKPAAATTSAAVKKPAAKKAPVVRTTWRTRQSTPTSDRYKEIQGALVARGYLAPEEATGSWGPASADALKKFQAEQTLETTGKIDSLSLIALGLGPKHDSAPVVADGNVQPDSGRN